MTVSKIFLILTAGSHELSPPKSKRCKSDQAEQAPLSNAIKEMPVETQKVSDLPHVSPSDIMPIPKADAALKGRGQTRSRTGILTSTRILRNLKIKQFNLGFK
jgi:hypothetical protein